MRKLKKAMSLAAGLGMLVGGAPALAESGNFAQAEKLRKLDIMLMVTALRCRHTAYGFQADYDRFASSHLSELNEAAQILENGLSGHAHGKESMRALDKISVMIANSYGQGHPTLSCQQLQQEARALSVDHRPGALLAAADRMIIPNDRAKLALNR